MSSNHAALALAKAQNELHDPCKDVKGHNYKYADLAGYLKMARPVLNKHGLALTQMPNVHYGEAGHPIAVSVETHLMHGESGDALSSTLSLPFEKARNMTAAQTVGSLITYARRYAVSAMLGLASEDTDAAYEVDRTPQAPAIPGPTDDQIGEWVNALAQCMSLEDLQSTWKALPKQAKTHRDVMAQKEASKADLVAIGKTGEDAA